MKISRRCLATLALLPFLYTGAFGQNRVTIYTAAPQDMLDRVIPAFEKSANVKVELIKGGSGDLINRLKAEKGRPTADVLFSVGAEGIEANPCSRRLNIDPPCRFNIDPGRVAAV